jgi:hypothetical protein
MAKIKAKLGAPIFPFSFLIDLPVAASQAFKRRSGQYVKVASGRADIADSGDSEIWGWALIGKDWTSSSTAGADWVTVDTFPYHVFEIPARDTFTASNLEGYIGDTCDLEVSTYQYADNGESNEDVIVVVGGDVDEQTLYVHMNPNKCYQTAIA